MIDYTVPSLVDIIVGASMRGSMNTDRQRVFWRY